MSNALFPSLPGLTWDRTRTPKFSNLVQTSVSGKETRVALWSVPRYTYSVGYDVLRSALSFGELQNLMGFWLQRQGSYDTFLFDDPDDDSITGQQIGIGDGNTTQFQLVRSFGGWTDPIHDINGAPTVYKADWQGSQLQYPTGRTNIVPYSTDFTHWTKSGSTVTGDDAAAPDSTVTADQMDEGTAASVHNVHYSLLTVVAGDVYTLSVFLKQGSQQFVGLQLDDGGADGFFATFDLQNGLISGPVSAHGVGFGQSAAILSVGSGWYLCSITGYASSASSNATARIMHQPDGGAHWTPSYTGISTTTYLWGAQLELGAVPTSRISTTTGSASAPADYSTGTTGIITFAAAPALGAVVTADFNYYWRCRFTADEVEFNLAAYQWWELKKLEWITCKL